MTIVHANAARIRGGDDRRSTGATRAFHRRLPGYEPTRVVDAPALAATAGVRQLLIKDESSRLGLPSFKILGASWATYRLLCTRLGRLGRLGRLDRAESEPAWRTVGELRAALSPLGPLTLVAATDGNHGRAVARVARWLGYGARIFVPTGTAAARIEGIESEGATVSLVAGSYDDAVAASAALASDAMLVVSDTSWDGYVEIPSWVIEGYSTIFDELDEQLGGRMPDAVVVQMGVGALAAATAEHLAARSTVIVVEPVDAACGLRSAQAGEPVHVPGPHRSIMAGMNCGTVSVVAWPRIHRGADYFVAVEDGAAEDAMRDFASAGVIAGETGAAGLAGLRAATASGLDLSDASVLLLCTEGATDPVNYERIVGAPPT
jgi:diaminopropionate ammonia-lyase